MTIAERHAIRMELYSYGMTDSEIAERLGCPAATISSWRYKHKLPANGKLQWKKPEVHAEFLELYQMGMSDHKIAAETGYGIDIVKTWRYANNLPHNDPRKPHIQSRRLGQPGSIPGGTATGA